MEYSCWIMVVATTKGGPVATAGVHVCNVIVKVGGESMDATYAKLVNAKCRDKLERMTKLS